MNIQPIDCNHDVVAVMESFPVGSKFHRKQVASKMNWSETKAGKFLRALRDGLEGCDEGIQLNIRKGSIKHGGGCQFVYV